MRAHGSRFLARRAVSLIVALVGVMLFSIAAVRADPASPTIVGGQEADPGEWPWQVVLVQKGANPINGAFCGGSIITRDWVLTAAHCVDTASTSDLDVVVGIHDLRNPNTGFVRVALSQIVVHPGWNDANKDNDLALLKLAQPVPARAASGSGLPIAYSNLATSAVGNLAGRTSTVTGWGNRSSNGSDFPDTLHEVEVPIISNADCAASYGNLTDNMLCAGLPQGGKDSCQGDSGGPLVVYDQATAKWQQVGIVSFGIGCAEPGYPGVYARVSRYTNWINSYVNPVVMTNRFLLPFISNVPYVPPASPLVNGNFEQGPGKGWAEESSNGFPLITNDFLGNTAVTAHSGSWAAWLGGLDDETSVLSQQVTLAPGQTVLSYYYWIGSEDICGFDFAGVFVKGNLVKSYDLCDSTDTGGWVRGTANVSAYVGQRVLLEFVVETDGSGNSNFFLDDVALGPSLTADQPAPDHRAPGSAAAPKGQ